MNSETFKGKKNLKLDSGIKLKLGQNKEINLFKIHIAHHAENACISMI